MKKEEEEWKGRKRGGKVERRGEQGGRRGKGGKGKRGKNRRKRGRGEKEGRKGKEEGKGRKSREKGEGGKERKKRERGREEGDCTINTHSLALTVIFILILLTRLLSALTTLTRVSTRFCSLAFI